MAKIKIALVVLIFLVFNNITWGQSDISLLDKKNYLYAVRLTNFQFNITHSEDGICSNLVEVSARLNDNTQQAMLSFSDHNYSFPNRIFLFNKKLKYLHIFAKSVDKTSRPWPLSNSCDQEATVDKNSSTITDCNSVYFEAIGSHSDVKNKILFTYVVIPLHTLNAENINGLPNTYLPVDDKVILYAKEGFSSTLYHYQYRLQGESTWSDISGSLYNADKLTVSAKDLFGSNYESHLGKTIQFRVVSCYDNGAYLSFSDPVLLTLIQSSPHITGKTASPTKCYDTTDGSVTITFDRTLLAGETLTGSLVNTVTHVAVSNPDFTTDLQSATTVTIENLPPGSYRLDLMGEYNGHATYTDTETHMTEFEITRPTQVISSFVSKTDVFCYSGSDGIINISASGGQNQYQYSIIGDNGTNISWTNFTSGSNASITNLPAGTYQIKVQDSNGCPAKESSIIQIITVQITQPSGPITLSETEIVQPTGFGLSNGYISVRVTGGTANTDGSYNFEWHKDTPTGVLISTGIITDAVSNPFTIKLGNIPAGKYYLTVKDKNYAGASSQLGSCGILSQEYEVTQPELLEVAIKIKQIISCNIGNDYTYKLDRNNNGIPDEAENGILTATATGGVGNYTYQWQKLVSGSFQDMAGAIDSTLSQLPEGTYKIVVKDVNNNIADAQTVFNYPAVLQISLSANTILCNNANEGEVSVSVTGGTAPYTYTWNTSDTTPSLTGLSAGNYFVVVQDANLCTVSGNITIEQPGQLQIEDIQVKNPVCNGASNGAIQIKATGGKTPYSIAWSNGITGENLSGLNAGNYTVTFTDANGCILSKEYTLTDPEALTIDLGNDITLCQGDTQIYDIKITDPGASYQWTDGNGNSIGTNSSITLSQAGTYTALVIDSKGCTATDQVVIRNSMEVLSPEFMLATHAFIDYTIQLVNTSPEKPEKVEWVLPDNPDITVVYESDEYMELRFTRTGSYRIGLKGKQGECEKTFYKDIMVEENTMGVEEPSSRMSNIEEFTIGPNPNNGNYKVIVKLYKEAGIKLRIMNLLGQAPYPMVSRPQAKTFEVPFQYNLSNGTYLIILETGAEVRVKKMLVE